jgi:hypothetical protein
MARLFGYVTCRAILHPLHAVVALIDGALHQGFDDLEVLDKHTGNVPGQVHEGHVGPEVLICKRGVVQQVPALWSALRGRPMCDVVVL